MSNLSDIGFPVRNEQDVNKVIMDVLPLVKGAACPPYGYYYKFEDPSGAEIFVQTNPAQEIIGFNPAFGGKSVREVEFTGSFGRDTSELDGAFQVFPADSEYSAVDMPAGMFVFDVPDYRSQKEISLSERLKINLTAFASSNFQMFDDRTACDGSFPEEPGSLKNSFVAKGISTVEVEDGPAEQIPQQAHANIVAEIVEFERRPNDLTGVEFSWFLTETYGGQLDIVADSKLVKTEPRKGGIIKGSFWLSGKILKEIQAAET